MTDQEIPGPDWIPKFLAALRESGLVKSAVEAAGVSPGSIYFQRRRNRLFFDAWKTALGLQAAAGADEAAPDIVPARNAGWRPIFFAALAETSNVSASALRANVPADTVFDLRRDDPRFAARWLQALHEGYDNLEMEALCYLRDPNPKRKMDVGAALRLLAAHRETVERRRALTAEEDEQATVEALDAFFEGLRQRRLANEKLLDEPDNSDESA